MSQEVALAQLIWDPFPANVASVRAIWFNHPLTLYIGIQYNCDCHWYRKADLMKWISSPFKKFKPWKPWIHFVQRTMLIQQSGHRKGMTADDAKEPGRHFCVPPDNTLTDLSVLTKSNHTQVSATVHQFRLPVILLIHLRINTSCIKGTNLLLVAY